MSILDVRLELFITLVEYKDYYMVCHLIILLFLRERERNRERERKREKERKGERGRDRVR